MRELLTEDYGVAVIGGARHAAATKNASAAGQSMLTQALTEGLQGKADADHDGTVYLQELGQYVSERVRVRAAASRLRPWSGHMACVRFPLPGPAHPLPTASRRRSR